MFVDNMSIKLIQPLQHNQIKHTLKLIAIFLL